MRDAEGGGMEERKGRHTKNTTMTLICCVMAMAPTNMERSSGREIPAGVVGVRG